MALLQPWVTEVLAVVGASGSIALTYSKLFRRPGVTARYTQINMSHRLRSYDLFLSNVGAFDVVVHRIDWVHRPGMPILVNVGLELEPMPILLKPGQIQRISIKISNFHLQMPRDVVFIQMQAANGVSMSMYVPIKVDQEQMGEIQPRAMTSIQTRIARLLPWKDSY